jgi:hypothetical protein
VSDVHPEWLGQLLCNDNCSKKERERGLA